MSLASWMCQVVTVASVTGVDSYGKATYGAQRAVKANVSEKTRSIRTVRGEEAVASHVIYALEEIRPTDRVWLPGVPTTSADGARRPLTVSTAQDKTLSRTLWKVEL